MGLVSGSGVTASTSFDPWGEVFVTQGETTYLGFQGDPTDTDSGLVDMGSRYYLPFLGSFTSIDPVVGDPASPALLNRFVYGLANPLTYSDSFGLYACEPGPICRPEAFQTIPDFTAEYLVPAAETNVALGHVNARAIDPPQPLPPPAPQILARLGKIMQRVSDIALRIDEQATRYSWLLRSGSSSAGRLLPKFGGSAFDDLVGVLGRPATSVIGVIGTGIEFWMGYSTRRAQGESRLEAVSRESLKTGGEVAGVSLGARLCPAGPAACVAGIVGGGFLGSVAGGKLGDLLDEPSFRFAVTLPCYMGVTCVRGEE